MAETKLTQGIHKAMLAVMGEIGAIGKNQQVTQGRAFNYRGIDDIYNQIQPALVKCGVLVMPELLDQEVRDTQTSTGKWTQLATVRIKYIFYASDGSHIEATTGGAATDSGGRAIAQAQSDAYKQAIFKTFCVQTHDQDAEKHMEQMAGPEGAGRDGTPEARMDHNGEQDPNEF